MEEIEKIKLKIEKYSYSNNPFDQLISHRSDEHWNEYGEDRDPDENWNEF